MVASTSRRWSRTDCWTERSSAMTSPTLPLGTESLAITPDSFPIHGGPRPLPEAVSVNGQPLTLAEVVDHEAMGYRGWGTPTGDFLARQMERLAQLIRWTNAMRP